MGTSSSTTNKKIRCSYCTCYPYKISDRQIHEDNGVPVCPRCEGYVYKKPRNQTAPPPEVIEATSVRELQYLRVAVFQSSLLVCDEENPTPDFIRDNYLTPYFTNSRPLPLRAGLRIQAKGLDFKIISTHPPEGIVTSNTVILCNQNNDLCIIDDIAPLERVHILPMDATVNSNIQDIFQNYIRPWMRSDPDLVLMEGEVFVSQNVQFKIFACRPHSGRVTPDVEIHTDGQRFADLQSITLVPVFETLPNREKNMRPREILRKYLNSFLLGSFCYLRRDQEIEIDGVKFAVMECQPPEGYTTSLTEIRTSPPIHAQRLLAHQLERDEALARHLQVEEDQNINRRLQNLILNMHNPPNARVQGPPRMLELNALLEQLRQAQNRPVGLTTTQLSMLPTRKYKKPENLGKEDEEDPNDDGHTCRICLMNYEEGDLLRTLTCFHSYHADCIDRWLNTSTSCPICRSEIGHL